MPLKFAHHYLESIQLIYQPVIFVEVVNHQTLGFSFIQFLIFSQRRHIFCSRSFAKMFSYIFNMFNTFWHFNFKFVITVQSLNWSVTIYIQITNDLASIYRWYHHTIVLTALSSIWVLLQVTQLELFKKVWGFTDGFFFKQRFTTKASLSEKPPYHGALIKLNFQLMFWFEANLWVLWDVETVPLSLNNSPGQHLRAINFWK